MRGCALWCSLLIGISIGAGASADEFATTTSGRRVLLRDNGTWVGVDDHAPGSAGTPGADTEQVIKQKCAREWPTDYNMQAYCQRQQREAVETLARGRPQDIPEYQFSIVRTKCASDWPDDFNMRAYCERQQYDAIRRLR